MRLLVAHGADPIIPTIKPAGATRVGDNDRGERATCPTLPPVPVGGPGMPPLLAAAGVGYGKGFAGNAHRFAPGGMLRGRQVPGRGAAAPTSTPSTTRATPRSTTPRRAATTR